MKCKRFPAALAWLMALSLMLSLVWGQWHRVTHEAWLQEALVDVPSDASRDHSGHEPGSALCQVLDHLAHSDSLSCAPSAKTTPALASVAPVAVAASPVPSSAHRYFQARAPPFSV